MDENLAAAPPAETGGGLWRLAIASVVAFLGFAYSASFAQGDLADFALGRETKSIFGAIDGERVHCRNIDTAAECLEPLAVRGSEQTALWLGNSQLHAINQIKAGDETAPVQLAQGLRTSGIDLVTFSQPNASLLENYVVFEWIADQQQIDTIILPLVFDDTRERGVRDQLAVVFDDQNFRQRFDFASVDLDAADFGGAAEITEDAPEEELLIRDRSEEVINTFLEEQTGFNSAQLTVRGQVSINLFYLRNTLLGIDPTTARPILPAAYRTNMAALEQILASAQQRGTRVILYLAPIRSDIRRPYIPREYRQFTEEVAILAESHGVELMDFAEIVPGELYGMKDATRFFGGPEYDFMHFRADGHKILAERLLPLVEARAR